MNVEVLLDKQDDNKSLVSTELELEELAEGIASEYIKYLRIDVIEQKRKSDDSIEECLTHLEEVCSVLENYRQNSDELGDIVKDIASKKGQLERLYDQIDALEQYIFEVNKSLDQLDTLMKELLNLRSFAGRNRIKQIIDLLPKISLMNSMPRLNLFNSFSGLIGEATGTSSFLDERQSTLDNTTSVDSSASIGEILAKVSNIRTSIEESTSSLNHRLDLARSDQPPGKSNTRNDEQQPNKDANKSSLNSLNCDSPEQVDGSWQELL